MTTTRNVIVTLIDKSISGIIFLSPALDLFIRVYVAKVFWMSGQTKIQSWESTLMLFEYEYAVPIIPFDIAAYAATSVELVAPVMLVLGLGTRLGAVSLFALNYVATISYPDINVAGIKDHLLWGTMLAVSFFHGPGKLSVDHLLRRKILS